ncbi:hypothetical protein AU074_22085 [Pseudomonas sp. ATCC PTA-122608]|nr:hypothetical protein AU074_22085 [Pseudomonas sp. ATCC PTA-122608]
MLRVNAPVSFGVQHLAPLWGEFMKAYPNVELDISLNDRLVDLWRSASMRRCALRGWKIRLW